MSDVFVHDFPYGANLQADGRTKFRLWAPAQETVSVALENGPILPMARTSDGWFEAVAVCSGGSRYRYRLADGTLVPDPASRFHRSWTRGIFGGTDSVARYFQEITPSFRRRPYQNRHR